MSRLDTGNSKPISPGVLEQALHFMVDAGHTILEEIKDVQGRYAILLKTTEGLRYYLIAKGSALHSNGMFNVVSTQKTLALRARDDERPILLYWKMGIEDPRLRVYNPEEILKHQYPENKRLGVVMVNFNYDLGDVVYYPNLLHQAWAHLKISHGNRGLVGPS